MGWQIANIENSVVLTKEQAINLLQVESYFRETGGWYEPLDHLLANGMSMDEILEACFEMDDDGYYLYFDVDAMEHMDYLEGDTEILQCLSDMGVQGDITFGSLEGDNSGSFWGYRFYGGTEPYKLLEGEVRFFESDVK